MSARWKLDQQYADIMQHHPFGIALYRPLPLSTFNIGSCGYFDEFGSWNPIAHLKNIDSLQEKGLAIPDDELERAPIEDGIEWGPKTSKRTKEMKVELSGGVDPATGIPLTVSSIYSYSTDTDVGAVLLASNPVTHERFYHKSPFKNWVKKNALTILQRWPEVKEHGVWIVASTFAAAQCEVNMWHEKGKSFQVGFSAEAMGFGKIGNDCKWHTSQRDEGWAKYSSKGDDKVVVFFGGLKFQYTWAFGKDLKTVSRPVLRGPHGEEKKNEAETITTIPDPEYDEGSYFVDCEEYLGDEDEPKTQDGGQW
ncbi:hypothetical protein NLJ89_g8143 [Agrocybe chaxingu]|uniref:Uncharacterized protein n=1 Tax=Agrocybe chaxingu TaxID=84603 RepID=A0A9W8JVG2_9AGAR|nr:hypothetical protein NLJ89_g8143 [Agrocybe chaxingu]